MTLTHSLFRPLILGNGRLAQHLEFYLTQLGLAPGMHRNSRELPEPDTVTQFTHLWMMVPDSALSAFAEALWDRFPEKPLIHSSAAISVRNALTLHPLMTFNRVQDQGYYSMESYRNTPFTVFHEELQSAPGTLEALREAIPNPIIPLRVSQRERYHLNCVMISNLSILLWDAAMRCGPELSRTLFQPILEQTVQNFMLHGSSALTGPLARGDHATLERHLAVLKSRPEEKLYRAFLEYYAHRT